MKRFQKWLIRAKKQVITMVRLLRYTYKNTLVGSETPLDKNE